MTRNDPSRPARGRRAGGSRRGADGITGITVGGRPGPAAQAAATRRSLSCCHGHCHSLVGKTAMDSELDFDALAVGHPMITQAAGASSSRVEPSSVKVPNQVQVVMWPGMLFWPGPELTSRCQA